MKYQHILLALSALVLTQCTSLDSKQCQHADWFSLGHQDGNNGGYANKINDYAEDCAEFGIRVDHAQWREGYLTGLQNYCQPENGYLVGLAGEGYAGVCSSNAFVEQYNAGYQQHQLNQRADNIRMRLQHIDYEIRDLDQKLTASIDKAATLEKKKQLLNEKDRLVNELRYLHNGHDVIFKWQL
ncbi:DUF2799 domain-containing protein [Shewanella algidipiscicola]|uniref:DUF2799 domain-containing protein n=1 Tax=Shewanella algidipiscicola TaxID=614070 RepID=A0ABQ4PLS6_9GAMM|nr:DUF2799 domain-containing protein [Shewanella algidipiscicola]GIU49087.1 DUF2799 domain-containing protein [Shewanella algidipiscicola]